MKEMEPPVMIGRRFLEKISVMAWRPRDRNPTAESSPSEGSRFPRRWWRTEERSWGETLLVVRSRPE